MSAGVTPEWPESQPYIGDDDGVLVNSGSLYEEAGDAAVIVCDHPTMTDKGEER